MAEITTPQHRARHSGRVLEAVGIAPGVEHQHEGQLLRELREVEARHRATEFVERMSGEQCEVELSAVQGFLEPPSVHRFNLRRSSAHVRHAGRQAIAPRGVRIDQKDAIRMARSF